MAKVKCDIYYTSEINDRGFDTDCVVLCCQKCDHETQSWGHGDASVKRCLALMNEECPLDENNFYVEE